MDKRLGTCNVRSIYRSYSLKTAARLLTKNKSDLVAVQQIRWDNSGSQLADNDTFFYRSGNANYHLGTGLFIPKGILSAVKRVGFLRDRMLYMILRCHRCDILLHEHAPTEEKYDDIKNSF
jgi:hypothetical protein